MERLNSQYLGQIVQILINLEHFEEACHQLEQELIRARSSTSAGGPVSLKSTEEFRSNKKTAEKRIFELVNSKIDDLVDTSDYNWYVRLTAPRDFLPTDHRNRMTPSKPTEPSNYMQTLTRYLENIMGSTLLGLPREIKELIYFDALSHAANKILVSHHLIPFRTLTPFPHESFAVLTPLETVLIRCRSSEQALPLSPDVKKINANAVAAMAMDVQHLSAFVANLENAPMLEQNLDELQQTIALMQSDNHDEFFDISTRNKKYGRVDAMNGPMLLEK